MLGPRCYEAVRHLRESRGGRYVGHRNEAASQGIAAGRSRGAGRLGRDGGRGAGSAGRSHQSDIGRPCYSLQRHGSAGPGPSQARRHVRPAGDHRLQLQQRARRAYLHLLGHPVDAGRRCVLHRVRVHRAAERVRTDPARKRLHRPVRAAGLWRILRGARERAVGGGRRLPHCHRPPVCQRRRAGVRLRQSGSHRWGTGRPVGQRRPGAAAELRLHLRAHDGPGGQGDHRRVLRQTTGVLLL
jgi:hypothetical protein